MDSSDCLPDYCVSGNSETTVFLLHGVYGAKEYWRFLMKRLVDEGYRSVAWDAPGYGISLPDPDFNLMSAARACVRLVEKVGSRSNILLGQSMGGQISMRAYGLAPHLFDAVIITSTIGYIGNKTPEEREEFVRSRSSSESDRDSVAAKNLSMVESMMAPGVVSPDVDLVKQIGAGTPGPAVQASVRAIQNAPDQEAITALHSIDVPSLFIAGELDQTGRADGMQRIANMVPGSQFAVIPGCGHYTWAEDSKTFWQVLHPFLSSVSSKGMTERAYRMSAK